MHACICPAGMHAPCMAGAWGGLLQDAAASPLQTPRSRPPAGRPAGPLAHAALPPPPPCLPPAGWAATRWTKTGTASATASRRGATAPRCWPPTSPGTAGSTPASRKTLPAPSAPRDGSTALISRPPPVQCGPWQRAGAAAAAGPRYMCREIACSSGHGAVPRGARRGRLELAVALAAIAALFLNELDCETG